MNKDKNCSYAYVIIVHDDDDDDVDDVNYQRAVWYSPDVNQQN